MERKKLVFFILTQLISLTQNVDSTYLEGVRAPNLEQRAGCGSLYFCSKSSWWGENEDITPHDHFVMQHNSFKLWSSQSMFKFINLLIYFLYFEVNE